MSDLSVTTEFSDLRAGLGTSKGLNRKEEKKEERREGKKKGGRNGEREGGRIRDLEVDPVLMGLTFSPSPVKRYINR